MSRCTNDACAGILRLAVRAQEGAYDLALDSGLQRSDCVTIGLPTYNGAGSIARAIDSVLAQTYPNIELVVSDNASSDGTAEIVLAYASRDPRVRYVRQPENIGLTANFNFVLRMASGSYFMWLSDDDWMEPNYVQACLRYVLEHPDCCVACGLVKFYDGDRYLFDGEVAQIDDETPMQRVLHWYRTVAHAGMIHGVYRKESLGEGFPLPGRPGEDQYLIAAVCAGGKAATLTGVVLNRARTGASATSAGLMRAYGLPPRNDFMVQCYKGACAEADVMSNPAYMQLHPVLRRTLGLRCRFILTFRDMKRMFSANERLVLWRMKQSSFGRLARRLRDALLPVSRQH